LVADVSPDGAGARRRIIVISAGEDSEWGKNRAARTNPVPLTQYLIDNTIVVDAALVSTVDENELLWAICELTGGLAFRARTKADGLQLFEQEAFLNITIRKTRQVYPAPITQEVFIARVREFNPDKYAIEAGNHAVAESKQTFPLASPRYAICQALWNRPPSDPRLERVISEVKWIRNAIPADIQVWANYERIDKLRVFFEGPARSPFADRWWTLFITFPLQYPKRPPDFRFVDVPYHPNVSLEGKVLFMMLDRAYTPERRVVDLIIATRNLLGKPEAGEALNRNIGQQFISNRAE
jgi:ubiquitin-protein ligase